jgi:simple sugar transport system substrate-binding protein
MLRHTKLITLLLIVVVLAALAGCGGSTPTAAPATQAPAQQGATQAPAATQPILPTQPGATLPSQVTQANMTIGLAVHADPAVDAFWAVVVKGAKDAAATYGITLKSGGSDQPTQQAQLIQNYVAAKVDGIIVSMANPDALKDAIKSATDAGIPVITINSGESRSKEFGALVHVGQSENVAGQGAGSKFNEAGVKHLICVVHEEANIGLEDRCAGAKATFKGQFEEFSVASTGVKDVAGTLKAIQNKLTADKSIDGILALNTTIAIAARDAAKAAGSNAKIATFDLSPDVLTALQNGEMLFAIDQQQYLQGYLPVVFLYLYKTNLNTVGGGLPIYTGPGFVTKDNAAAVKDLSAKGTR